MLRKLLAKLTSRPKTKLKTKSRAKPKTKPVRTAKKKPAPRSKKQPKKAPKQKQAAPPGDQVGEVVAFFRIPVVAVIRVTKGRLKTGDRIWIKGHTTDLRQTVTSMQVNHQPIEAARKGDEVGLKVDSRTRLGDRVYLISP